MGRVVGRLGPSLKLPAGRAGEAHSFLWGCSRTARPPSGRRPRCKRPFPARTAFHTRKPTIQLAISRVKPTVASREGARCLWTCFSVRFQCVVVFRLSPWWLPPKRGHHPPGLVRGGGAGGIHPWGPPHHPARCHNECKLPGLPLSRFQYIVQRFQILILSSRSHRNRKHARQCLIGLLRRHRCSNEVQRREKSEKTGGAQAQLELGAPYSHSTAWPEQMHHCR